MYLLPGNKLKEANSLSVNKAMKLDKFKFEHSSNLMTLVFCYLQRYTTISSHVKKCVLKFI